MKSVVIVFVLLAFVLVTLTDGRIVEKIRFRPFIEALTVLPLPPNPLNLFDYSRPVTWVITTARIAIYPIEWSFWLVRCIRLFLVGAGANELNNHNFVVGAFQ